MDGCVDVREYGAAGDGVRKDTAAIQRALDACAARGGGVVLFPPGNYLSGTVYLRDNVCLDLMPGATLRGSTDPRDYNADDFCPQNRATPGEKASGAHLIVGLGLKNVTLRGGGRIDGSGPAFFAVPAESPHRFTVPGWRPGQMIFLCECRNVRLAELELLNSPYWTCFLHGCRDVLVHGVRIWNDRRTMNGDGIDIDCCQQVLVSDCLIDGGDDCIALRGNVEPLTRPQPCEDIAVTNCILKTRANGVRIGVGDGIIRRAVFSNLVIGGPALDGICIQSNYCYTGNLDQDQSRRGVEISDISFQNIQMPDVRSALYIAPGYEGGKTISDLHFDGIHARASKGSTIMGGRDNPLGRVSLSRIDIHMSGRQEYLLPPEKWDARLFEWNGCRPAGLYLADCHDLEMNGCRLTWGETTGPWRYGLWGRRLKDLRLTGCRLAPPPGSGDGSAIVLEEVPS